MAENRHLQYLNMSWNNLLPLESLNSNIEREAKIGKEEIKGIKDSGKKQLPKAVTLIIHFIKYNKNLLHLNLSHTCLNEQALSEIGASLKKGKSILALHLTGNPGITDNLKTYLFNRIKCGPLNKKESSEESQKVSHGGSHAKRQIDMKARSSLDVHVMLLSHI